jgi:hypothetical protein
VIAASAIRKVEEQWRERLDAEVERVRDEGSRSAHDEHLRIVALKAQMVDMQARLQVRARPPLGFIFILVEKRVLS